jgi:hypothetical protein
MGMSNLGTGVEISNDLGKERLLADVETWLERHL